MTAQTLFTFILQLHRIGLYYDTRHPSHTIAQVIDCILFNYMIRTLCWCDGNFFLIFTIVHRISRYEKEAKSLLELKAYWNCTRNVSNRPNRPHIIQPFHSQSICCIISTTDHCYFITSRGWLVSRLWSLGANSFVCPFDEHELDLGRFRMPAKRPIYYKFRNNDFFVELKNNLPNFFSTYGWGFGLGCCLFSSYC